MQTWPRARGESFGQEPPPHAPLLLFTPLCPREGFYRRKRFPFRGLFNPRGQSPVLPGPHRPAARRGGRTPSGVRAGGAAGARRSPRWQREWGRRREERERHRISRGGKKRNQGITPPKKGITQRGPAGTGPRVGGAKGGLLCPTPWREHPVAEERVAGRCGRREDSERREVETAQPSFYFYFFF